MHSFDEILEMAPYKDTVRWHGRAGTAGVGVRDLDIGRGTFRPPFADFSGLVVYRKPARISYQISGNAPVQRKFLPGDLLLRPRRWQWEAEFVDDVEVTAIALECNVVKSLTTDFNADVGEVFGRLEVRPFRSPVIEGLVNNLRTATAENADRLYADAMIFALVQELWRLCKGTTNARETEPGALGDKTLRRIDELIDTASNGELRLERLADTVSMTMVAFSTAVKAATGQTPYQYVLSRRIEKARNLIESTRLSLAEVAFRCGFASQSHMTDVFRAKLGTTPGKLRADKV